MGSGTAGSGGQGHRRQVRWHASTRDLVLIGAAAVAQLVIVAVIVLLLQG